jgi:tRNA dimethylallyltransferase
MKHPIDYIGIYGPTASGKTAISLELARQYPIEIISVDSALVYQEMDIGTAKPSIEQQSTCQHHLIDIISPEQNFSVGQFHEKAISLIKDIRSRHKVPLLVGGTALYFQSLSKGYANLPVITDATCSHVTAQIHEQGLERVFQHLCSIDLRHQQIKPNDKQRINRAACVYFQTKQSIFDFWTDQKAQLDGHIFSLNILERTVLKEQINHRLSQMLEQGLIDETEHIIHKYHLLPEHNSMRCVGYRQIYDMLRGIMPKTDLKNRIYYATCQYAKRQLTWLNLLKTERITEKSHLYKIDLSINKMLSEKTF